MKIGLSPPAYFMGAVMLTLASHYLFPLAILIKTPFRYWAVILIFFGIFLNIWADTLLKKHKTTVKPNEKPIGTCLLWGI